MVELWILDTILIAWSIFFLRCTAEFGAQKYDETIAIPLMLSMSEKVVTHHQFLKGWVGLVLPKKDFLEICMYSFIMAFYFIIEARG